jgi:uncharacterized glyoxalase superfamily protein PhnB
MMTKLDPGSLIVPVVRYQDAFAAIAFLERAFGFERRVVVPGETPNSVGHAQLTFGSRMLMLATLKESEFDHRMKLPKDVGGSTQALYIIVEEVDAHCARALAAGARIVTPLEDWDHGGRGYTCMDCEGHIWSFGTYNPWTASP